LIVNGIVWFIILNLSNLHTRAKVTLLFKAEKFAKLG